MLTSAAATHPGTVRDRNEDAFLDRADIGLWAVADGAGGHGAGDVASAAVVAALQDLPPGLSASEMLAQVRLRVAAVNAALRQQAGPGRIIATTLVVLLARGGHFACLWAGDSRVYLWRAGVLRRLTRDHSLVQDMVEAGTLDEAAAEQHPQANIITRAIGADDEVELDKMSDRIASGDVFLLCSDGLFKALSEVEISALLAVGPDAVVSAALRAGARDNVTAVVVTCA